MNLQAPKKGRGLAAIQQARDERGRGSRGKYTPSFVIGAAVLVACSLVGYKIVNDRDLNVAKEKIFARREAAMKTIGAEWFPMRDRIEASVLEAAKGYAGDFVDPSVSADAPTWAFRGQPGIYLRLRVADAKDAATIRKLAPFAKKDAFAGCFLREPNVAAARGELDGGAFAEQPWNLAQAYSAARVLGDEFAAEVREAPDSLHLRVFEQQYDMALNDQLPIAARVVKGAQFFLLALDEDVPEAAALSDGGAITEDVLQTLPHPTRVYLIDLKTGREMVRMKRIGQATTVAATGHVVTDPAQRDAIQRQVNNCNLADQIMASIAPAPPPVPAPSNAAAVDAGRPSDAGKARD